MLKQKEDVSIAMMYRNYTNEILFPNQNFGLYAVQSLTLNLQKKDAAPCRSASARMTRATHPQYYTIDLAQEEPDYACYAGFDQAGPSRRFEPKHSV